MPLPYPFKGEGEGDGGYLMYSIFSFSVSRLNNAEFVSFFLNLKKAIDTAQSTNLGLDGTMMSEFTSVLQKLTEQVRSSTASQYTAAMDAAHSKRIQVFKRIIYKLRAVEVAEDQSDLLSCKTVVETYLLGIYSMAVSKLPLQEITPVINGFCYDLRDKLSEDDLDALSITSDLSRLEQANADFISAYNNRADERAQTGNGVTVALRAQMNDIFLNICYTTQYLANSQAESNATKAAACQPFIDVVNQYLQDAKTRYNARMAALKKKGENVPSGDDTSADDTPADENPGTENPGGNPADENPGEGVHEVEV